MATSPDLGAADPYVRPEQTFPVLPPDMVRRVSEFGEAETFADGALLFERGQRSVDFFLILSGACEIFDTDGDGDVRVVHVHAANQFTGELDLFNSRQILVSGRARGETRAVRVRRGDFRAMIAAEPDIGEIIMRAFILRRVGLLTQGQGGAMLIGPAHGGDTVRIQRFLSRNGYPLRLVDTESEEDWQGFVEGFGLTENDLPVVIADEQPLRNPSDRELADVLGISIELDPAHTFQLVVVGAGPAGLAAAVYAASEGLDTLILESLAPGGQAGTSSKIENYLGFPTGISGQALAGRAQTQAQKFGAKLAVSRGVTGIRCQERPFVLELDDGREVRAQAIVLATGVRYRKLDLPDYEKFEGAGIHYAATAIEATLCGQKPAIVVGGGNSAGQAAVFLSRHVPHVHMLVRGEGLAATMSSYLIERIEASPTITLHPFTEVTALHGDQSLDGVTMTDRRSGEVRHEAVSAMFVMIGAEPNSDWLKGCVELDRLGFVCSGGPLSPYQTSVEGIFAVGDVRAGSVKRVASGVGEGSVVVQAIHKYLEGVSP